MFSPTIPIRRFIVSLLIKDSKVDWDRELEVPPPQHGTLMIVRVVLITIPLEAWNPMLGTN